MISAIGKASLQRDCVVPDSVVQKHSRVVSTMEQHGLLHRNSCTSSCTLTSMATVTVISMSNPCSVTRAPFTAFEGRFHLMQDGWAVTDLAYDCSVEGRRMMQFQCAEYYMLLKDCYQQVLQLTEHELFSHAQKRMYYTVVQTVCSQVPFEFCPVSLAISFYVELYDFIRFVCSLFFSITIGKC